MDEDSIGSPNETHNSLILIKLGKQNVSFVSNFKNSSFNKIKYVIYEWRIVVVSILMYLMAKFNACCV